MQDADVCLALIHATNTWYPERRHQYDTRPPSVLHMRTRSASFVCVAGLFQTFIEDFYVPFVDEVFSSPQAPVCRFSLTVRYRDVSFIIDDGVSRRDDV